MKTLTTRQAELLRESLPGSPDQEADDVTAALCEDLADEGLMVRIVAGEPEDDDWQLFFYTSEQGALALLCFDAARLLGAA